MNNDNIENAVEKRYSEKDRRKRKRMNVSGKSVFKLQHLLKSGMGKKIIKIRKKN